MSSKSLWLLGDLEITDNLGGVVFFFGSYDYIEGRRRRG